MAKKPLTPEQAEIKAMKKAKSSENWTKFWAVLLAAVLTVSVVFMGKTAAEDAISKVTGSSETTDENGDSTNNGGSTDSSDPFGGSSSSDPFGGSSSSDPFGGSSSTTPGSDSQNAGTQDNQAGNQNAGNQNAGNQNAGNQNAGNQNAGNQNAGNQNAGNQNAGTQNATAEVIKVFNEVTAKAAKGSYTIHREGRFTKNIDVGSATDRLNEIITGVDPNASLDSVVGGFLGINKPVDAEVVNGADEGFDGKYMLKAMNLTEADVDAAKIDGNKYMVKIKKCVTPDANSPLAHATNDYITFDQVNASIAEAVGSLVKVEASGSEAIYDNIIFTATVVDGKLTTLEYSYGFSATLAIKITVLPATGTGAAEVKGTYTNIKY